MSTHNICFSREIRKKLLIWSYDVICLTGTFCGGMAGNPGLVICPGPGKGVGGNPPGWACPGGGGRPIPVRGGTLGAA